MQTLIEKHLEAFLGMRFWPLNMQPEKLTAVESTLWVLMKMDAQVILEYKRALNENVISQGLYYLDWLLDHKAEIYFTRSKEI